MCMGHRNPRKERRKQVDATVRKQVEDLQSAPMASVRQKYRELFGEEPRSKHRESLFRRVANLRTSKLPSERTVKKPRSSVVSTPLSIIRP